MNDAAIREMLKAQKQEATPEKIDQIRKMMEGAMAKASKVKGTITETHTNIQVNQGLKSTDLVFNPPSTAKLMASPLKQSLNQQQK